MDRDERNAQIAKLQAKIKELQEKRKRTDHRGERAGISFDCVCLQNTINRLKDQNAREAEVPA